MSIPIYLILTFIFFVILGVIDALNPKAYFIIAGAIIAYVILQILVPAIKIPALNQNLNTWWFLACVADVVISWQIGKSLGRLVFKK